MINKTILTIIVAMVTIIVATSIMIHKRSKEVLDYLNKEMWKS